LDEKETLSSPAPSVPKTSWTLKVPSPYVPSTSGDGSKPVVCNCAPFGHWASASATLVTPPPSRSPSVSHTLPSSAATNATSSSAAGRFDLRFANDAWRAALCRPDGLAKVLPLTVVQLD
jgi:hypothetical protein